MPALVIVGEGSLVEAEAAAPAHAVAEAVRRAVRYLALRLADG